MVVGSDALLRGGNPILSGQYHIGCDVHGYGHAQRTDVAVYQPTVSSMGHKAFLEPVCGYHQEQEVVDHHDADPDDSSHVSAAFPASKGAWRRIF